MPTITDTSLKNALLLCFLHSTDSISITDAAGIIIDVNPAFTKMYGYTRQEAIGKTNALVRSSHSNTQFYRNIWRDIKDPEIGH